MHFVRNDMSRRKKKTESQASERGSGKMNSLFKFFGFLADCDENRAEPHELVVFSPLFRTVNFPSLSFEASI